MFPMWAHGHVLVAFLIVDQKDLIAVESWFLQRPRIKKHCEYSMYNHSFQFQGLCWTKISRETLQNLPYFMYTKTQYLPFPFFISCYFTFFLMNILVYVDIDQGIH